MRRVHFAFREERGGRFSAGHATHAVQVDATGAVEVTPIHHRRSGGGRLAARRPVRLATTSVRRGRQDLTYRGHRTPAARVDRGGVLQLRRGTGVVEQLRNGPDGVEQRWAFARRPGGRGDLVVRVKVGGMAYRGRTAGGLHFVDRTTGVGVRYGRATWVDGRGARTDVGGRYAGGEVVLRVPAGVVARSRYPALLDPVIGSEIGIDKPAHGPPRGEQERPAVAHGGGNFLVVWQDDRGTTTDVLGTRVSSTGAVQDSLGIAISTEKNDQGSPAVAFDGTSFLVVWQDKRSGTWDIYGARVSTAGVVQDTTGTAISTATSLQQRPAVAFDGTHYLVVWEDRRSGAWDIYGSRVSTAGLALDSSGIAISTASGDQQEPAVAFGSTGYLVTWQDKRSVSDWNIYGARVTTAGGLLDTTGKAISNSANDQQLPDVAFDGTNFLVVWQDDRNGAASTRWDIFGARVSTAAVVLEPAGIAISSYSTDLHDQKAPAVAFDGTNHLVAWQDDRNATTKPVTWDVYAARVSTAGAVVTTSGSASFPVSTGNGDQHEPALAFGGSQYLVAWSDARFEGLKLGSSSGLNIYGARISAAGAVLDPSGVPISIDLREQEDPAVAHDGTNYLVVWSEHRTLTSSSGWDIIGARVSAAGTVLGSPAGIVICAASNDQRDPAVAFGGSQYLVAWSDYRAVTTAGTATLWDIRGARISTAGAVTGTVTISDELNDQRHPAISHDGTSFLVVWEDSRALLSTQRPDIYGARVSAAGTVLETSGISISTAKNGQERPEVAFDGTNHLVVWQDYRNNTKYADIYGARLSPAGSLLDTTGIEIGKLTNDQQAPAVASAGSGGFVVVWQDKQSGTSWDIYAARVSTAGALLKTSSGLTYFAVGTATGDQCAPAITHDGHNYVVAWEDDCGTANGDLHGARVTAAGALGDKTPFVISAGTAAELGPALASAGDGQLLVAYHRPEATTVYGVDRVQGRLVVTHADKGAACQAAIDCKSGFCADGVCCDTACGGGVTTDCLACSVAAGAAVDGTCATAASGTTCRPAKGSCDVAETCDGTATTCPTDVYKTDGTACTGGTCKSGTCVPTPDGGPVDAGPDGEAGISGDAATDATTDAKLEGGADAQDAAAGDGTGDGPAEAGADLAQDAGEAGPSTDAGTEGGAPDSATTDAAGTRDAGGEDADAGPRYCVGPKCPTEEGCSCRLGAGAWARQGAAPLLVLGLLLLLRRGRRRAFFLLAAPVGLLLLLLGGCATTQRGAAAKVVTLEEARRHCAALREVKLARPPVQTPVDKLLRRIREAERSGREALTQTRIRRLDDACLDETRAREQLAAIVKELQGAGARVPPAHYGRFDALLRAADYSNAVVCGEALLSGANKADQCAPPPLAGAAARDDDRLAAEEAAEAAELESVSKEVTRAHSLVLSVGIGLGSVDLGGVHEGAEDLRAAFNAQNPNTQLSEAPTSGLQLSGELSVRYYFPYQLLAQVGLGSIYNSASTAFGVAGTLSNDNVALEIPLLVGAYYSFGGLIDIYAAVGPSFLVWSGSYWRSDPGGAPDFEGRAGVGGHFVGGADLVFSKRWALGLDLRYRLLAAGQLRDQASGDLLTSGELLGDSTRKTYDLDLSGLGVTLHLRYFVF
jgi:hypothetical protein